MCFVVVEEEEIWLKLSTGLGISGEKEEVGVLPVVEHGAVE